MRPIREAFCSVAQTAEAKLAFVRFADGLLHVTAFRGRSEKDRLSATCPACASPVTIRLGNRRVAHAAHRQGGGHDCIATVGESALHLNSKIALGLALQALADDAASANRLPELEIALTCLGADDCPLPARRVWAETWDRVEIECRVGVHRPDLVLTLDGRTVGALEVLVSHEVTPEKATALRILGVPWLEVLAQKLGPRGPLLKQSWRHGHALPVYRASTDSGQWYCPKHEVMRLLGNARQEYQVMKDRQGPDADELIAYGRELAATEKELTSILAEIADVERATDLEVARMTKQAVELPDRIAQSRRLVEVAKGDLAAAQKAAEDRTQDAREKHAYGGVLQDELNDLDKELVHYEGLRRHLSGYRPLSVVTDSLHTPIGRRTLYWCPIDVYRPPRRHIRHSATRVVFHMDLVKEPGRTTELWLLEDGNRRHCRIGAERDDAEARLRAALDARLSEWSQEPGAFVDRPCDWVAARLGRGIPNEAWYERAGPVPQAYGWDESELRWVLRDMVVTPIPMP